MGGIDWSLLWPFLQDLLRQFAERCGQEELGVQAANPVMQRWGVTRGLKAQGMHGRQLRLRRREALATLRNFSEEEVLDFVSMALESDDADE